MKKTNIYPPKITRLSGDLPSLVLPAVVKGESYHYPIISLGVADLITVGWPIPAPIVMGAHDACH
jgi:hypothetical protein